MNGQDIERLVLGVIADGAWAVFPETIATVPQGFLQAIDNYLIAHNLARTSLSGLVVVCGPGSATSLRASLALANAWAFAQSIELIGVQKRREEADDQVLARLSSLRPVPMLTPIYEQPAKITPSTKDSLGR